MYAVIQIDIPVGGEYHSSVGQLEDITYLVITQSLRRIDGGEQEFTGIYERCHPETEK